MNKKDAKAVLAELDRVEAVCDAVDDLRQLLREAKRQDSGWFEKELKRRRQAAHAAESVNHEPLIVNHNVK